MGLLKKFKNIFVEEYEDEEEEVVQMPSNFESRIPTRTEIIKQEPVEKKEIRQETFVKPEPKPAPVPVSRPVVRESAPVHVEEEKIKIEPVQPKKEDKFVFPVYFDDSDFENIEKKKEEKRNPEPIKKEIKVEKREVKKEEKKESSYKEAYNNKRANLTEDKKVFKPTPIISPVYGILDKNYYKEDIIVTTSVSRVYSPTDKAISIDDVRNKAYGTLEDDLENSLLTTEQIVRERLQNKNIDMNNSSVDDSEIFNENDFASAVEEDKKRDIAKDGLKADIESLLNNEEFTSAINFRKTKIEEPKKEVEKEIDDTIMPAEESEIDVPKETIQSEPKLDKKKQKDADLSLIDDIMALAAIGKKDKNEEKTNNVEINGNDIDDENDFSVNDNEDIELPDNITDDETLNAYDDVSDLNDSDLFNLIDSMYDKEDK